MIKSIPVGTRNSSNIEPFPLVTIHAEGTPVTYRFGRRTGVLYFHGQEGNHDNPVIPGVLSPLAKLVFSRVVTMIDDWTRLYVYRSRSVAVNKNTSEYDTQVLYLTSTGDVMHTTLRGYGHLPIALGFDDAVKAMIGDDV